MTQTLYQRAPSPEPLRVALWLDASGWRQWSAACARQLASTPWIRIVSVVHQRSLVPARQHAWLSRLSGPSPLEAAGTPALSDDLDSSQPVDVILYLGHAVSSEPLHAIQSTHGVWRFAFGDSDAAPYFWESYSNQPTSSLRLIRCHQTLQTGVTVAQLDAATRLGLRFAENQREPLAMAADLFLGALSQQLLLPEPGLPSPAPEPLSSEPYPSLFHAASFVVRKLARSLTLRLKARGRSMDWWIGLRPPGSDVWSAFPHPRACADPWLVDSGGRLHMFYEDIETSTGKGRIGVVEILGPDSFSEPRLALDLPYHLSYPAVVKDGDDFFMIPESSANATVDLYRAVEYPHKWQHVRTPLSGPTLVDTTPHWHQGRWYFFTTTIRPELGAGYQTFVFTSDRLDGDWNWHPANPICSDVRRARSAGPIFEREGRLFRPAQDCSVRYGYAMTLHEILELTPDRYREQQVGAILPDWTADRLATHTITSAAGWEARDALRWT